MCDEKNVVEILVEVEDNELNDFFRRCGFVDEEQIRTNFYGKFPFSVSSGLFSFLNF